MEAPKQAVSVFTRNVYGLTKIYPACSKAQAFACIAGKKTFDKRDITLIQELGFAVVFVGDPDVAAEFGGGR